MPNSRKRRNRPTHGRRQTHPPRRQVRVETVPGAEIESVPMREMVEQGPSSSDLAALANALESGKRGDLAKCLEHELSGRYFLESPHRFMLQDLLDQGDDAAPWAYSRWCLDLAAQSMLQARDQRFDKRSNSSR